jgi:hypothetical protein
VRTAHALEKLRVDLAYQTDRNREVLQPGEAVTERAHVVDDFVDVLRSRRVEELGFSGQEILKGALRAFDLAREHGLLANVHVDEQVGLGQRVD